MQEKKHFIIFESSQINRIEPARLSNQFTTEIVPSFTLQEVENKILNYSNSSPKVLGIHCMSNDVKSEEAQKCADTMESIISAVKANGLKQRFLSRTHMCVLITN